MAKQDKVYMICARVSDIGLPHVDSFAKKCSSCNEPVWISKGTIISKPDAKIIIICIECIAKHDLSDVVFEGPTAPQIAEIKESFRRRKR